MIYPVKAIKFKKRWLIVGDCEGATLRAEGGSLQGACTKWRGLADYRLRA
jgi:hypothetical protein